MARGRMLDRSFVKSQRLNGVDRDTRLAYAMILPFVDREGRHVAEPLVLKAIVFRWSDYDATEIAKAIGNMAHAGLITLHGDEDNAAILQIVRFHDHNSPNAKEARSDLSGPHDANARDVYDSAIIDALAMHGVAPGNARALHVENVNVNDNVNVNGNETTRANDDDLLAHIGTIGGSWTTKR